MSKTESSVTIPLKGYRGPDVIEWSFGSEVFLRCDADQDKGLVTGIVLRPGGCGYFVSWGNKCETFHYSFELSSMKDFST